MAELSIHNVENIEIEDAHFLSKDKKSKFYRKELSIQNENGDVFVITLFSDKFVLPSIKLEVEEHITKD